MALTVVVGGQYGSEGKGKLVSHLAGRGDEEVFVVRCGGPNAGHTAEGSLGRGLVRQVPSGVVEPDCQLLLAAGMQLDLDVLCRELEEWALTPERLCIDANATMIEAADVRTERGTGLYSRIGSTLTGTGAAAARKVMRHPSVRRAADVPLLRPFIGDVSARLADGLERGSHVVVEGTQGAGLSLHHGPYPYATGRDTTAAGFLSEAGLPPLAVTDVVLVLRTYPIRVGGPSGELEGELTWDEIARRAGYPTSLAEYTSVTGRLRRIGEFDWDLARRAVRLNGPTAVALHGADYLDWGDLGRRSWGTLGIRTRLFVQRLEERLDVPVRYVFTGPDGQDIIDRERDGLSTDGEVSTPYRSAA